MNFIKSLLTRDDEYIEILTDRNIYVRILCECQLEFKGTKYLVKESMLFMRMAQ